MGNGQLLESYWIQGIVVISGIFVGMLFSQFSSSLSHHGMHSNHSSPGHTYQTIEIGHQHSIPEIAALQLHKDEHQGWNLFFEVKHFSFAPESVGSAHIAGQGHAHFFINEMKTARLYGNWFHIDQKLNKGDRVKVTLNSNTHEVLTINGSEVFKEIIVP